MGARKALPLVRSRRSELLAGDPEAAARQRAAGKLTARERIGLLTDEASFVEIDALSSRGAGSGVVAGYGLVGGRRIALYAQDYTVDAGSVGASHADKALRALDFAAKAGVPVVALLDSAGARLGEGAAALDAYARLMAKSGELSGVVPQIALVLGPCGGGGAMCASLSDIVIIGGKGRLFLNAPRLVSGAIGEELDADGLGGAEASLESGAAHLAYATEGEAISAARRIIDTLPGNNLEEAPYAGDGDDANRLVPALDEIDGIEDMGALMAAIADAGSLIELSPAHSPEAATALAAMDGEAVGIVGVRGGRLGMGAMRKAARFVRFLDCFGIPAVTIVDCEGADLGAMPQGELTRACAQLAFAYMECSSPKVAVVAGSAIGAVAYAMASRASADIVYAWPGGVISPLAAPAAVQALYADRLRGAEDPIALRAELEEEYARDAADGLSAAEAGYADDVIDPSSTRRMIIAALQMLAGKRAPSAARKHGNMPL